MLEREQEQIDVLKGLSTTGISIEQARREDNQGNRIRRVRQMLFEQLGIAGEGEFDIQGYVDACRDHGYPGPWGVEVLSEELRNNPIEVIFKRAYDSTAAFAGGGARVDAGAIALMVGTGAGLYIYFKKRGWL